MPQDPLPEASAAPSEGARRPPATAAQRPPAGGFARSQSDAKAEARPAETPPGKGVPLPEPKVAAPPPETPPGGTPSPSTSAGGVTAPAASNASADIAPPSETPTPPSDSSAASAAALDGAASQPAASAEDEPPASEPNPASTREATPPSEDEPPASEPNAASTREATPPAEPSGEATPPSDATTSDATSGPTPPISYAAHTPRPASRPLLASEALIEDLAPVEPLSAHARILCAIAGATFGALGSLPFLGVHIDGRTALFPSLIVGAVTLFAAVTRVPYRKRAVAMVALGAIVAALGIAGMGPARGTAQGGAFWSVARMLAATTLPASLLFRARYRAFKEARFLLGLAFLAALPFVVHAVLLIVGGGAAFGFTQLGAILALLFLTAGLTGFMGSETTAAGGFVAPAMLAALALQAGFQRLGALVPEPLSEILGMASGAVEEGEVVAASPILLSASAIWDATATTVALGTSALLSALGLFQILSWRFAPAARRIDVHKSAHPANEDRPSVEDWSTRN